MLNENQIQGILEAMIHVSHYTLETQLSKNYTIDQKSDGSFVTSADLESQNIIIYYLRKIFQDSISIVSEEMSQDLCQKLRENQTYIVIDPIDGTEYFIKESDFLINLAIIENKEVTFGAIAVPKDGIIYYTKDNSLFKYNIENGSTSKETRILRQTNPDSLIIAGNRSCKNIITDIESSLFESKYKVTECIVCSTARRYKMLFDGKCDIVVISPFAMDWDIAAWEIILRILGYTVVTNLGEKITFDDLGGKSNGMVILNDSDMLSHTFKFK